jgi:hypothetical protein
MIVKVWDKFINKGHIIKSLSRKISDWMQFSEDEYYDLSLYRTDEQNYLLDIWGNKFIMEMNILYEPILKGECYDVNVCSETRRIFMKQLYSQNIVPNGFVLYSSNIGHVYSEKLLPKKFNISIKITHGWFCKVVYEGE